MIETTQAPRPGELTHNQLRPHVDAMLRQFEASASRVDEKVLTAKVKALGRACEKLLLGASFQIVGFDRHDQLVVRFQSESVPDEDHITMARGCRCKAGRRSRAADKKDLVCWHAAARVLLWLLAGKPSPKAPALPPSQQPRPYDPAVPARLSYAELVTLRGRGVAHVLARVQALGATLYACPHCSGAMVPTKTPDEREATLECSNGACQWTTYPEFTGQLVPMAQPLAKVA